MRALRVCAVIGAASVVAFASACSSSPRASPDGGSTDVDGSGGAPAASEGGGTSVDGAGGTTGADGAGTGFDGGSGQVGADGGSSGGQGGAEGGATGSDGGGTPARGTDGGACPSLTGPADKAYPRWPMPNPSAASLPNPSSYADNGNGTVRDNVTGLVWQKAVTQAATWANAPAYCSGLTLPAPAGFTWQVPTRIQLLSLVDYTTGAAVDGPFLGSGQPPGGKYTWTSTPWVVSQISTKAQDAWMVNFGGGGGLTSNAAAQTASEWVRCVAAAPVAPLPYPHYVQVDVGEVRDVETGLVWVQASHLTLLSQTDAVSYCAGLGLNGHTWRLPSVNELSSLVDDNPIIAKVSPAIDQCVFSDTSPNTYYMSSSIGGGSTPTPWALNYEDGFDSNSQTSGYVRCVR
jgi:hypothetical protein